MSNTVKTVPDTAPAINISREIFDLLAHEGGRVVVNLGFPHGIPIPHELLTSDKFRNAVNKGVLKNCKVIIVPG